jgi:hypothetical protein
MNSHEPKGKILNFLNGACENFYGNLHWSLEKKKTKLNIVSGRNMTVELDSRHPLLPKAGWGKWRFNSDLKKKLEIFADTSAFNAGVKEKNTKTNKISIKV